MVKFFIFCYVIAFIIFLVRTNPNWIGKQGENIVSKKLRSLPRAKYHVVNDVLIRNSNSTSQIDHVVISKFGIFVVETKNYKGMITGGQYSEEWTQHLRGQKNSFRNPIKQNYGHIKALEEMLDLDASVFVSVVVFSDKASLKVDTSEGVVNYKEIKKYIKSYKDEKLTSEQVIRYTDYVKSADINSKENKKKHVIEVHDIVDRRKNDIKKGFCPKCGGKLIKRKGKYGKFWGCSNYPQCKFTYNK